LLSSCNRRGLAFDEIYFCTHHPETGKCLCRKPGSLLLEKAIARFGIDPRQSVMIGDRDRDVRAAQAAGVRGILIAANSPLLPILEQI
jgi:D-glycero-D-manno-heptose 1,7-bisphosphate phosphatase